MGVYGPRGPAKKAPGNLPCSRFFGSSHCFPTRTRAEEMLTALCPELHGLGSCLHLPSLGELCPLCGSPVHRKDPGRATLTMLSPARARHTYSRHLKMHARAELGCSSLCPPAPQGWPQSGGDECWAGAQCRHKGAPGAEGQAANPGRGCPCFCRLPQLSPSPSSSWETVARSFH